ncbi:gamma-glutamylcyclotransferase family protein [Cellulomonas sp. NS3]|uniref:gamma-glutamylcyclotransferase family protein n=1 Tax=Cellulomonas sp. NS3 TaxID=2973977 RepID=UPI002161460E|nr:gamma-glutamylcyclotransferase family protein [Cellulomonas sp. NS3]
MAEHLFSYGTLQDPKVQRATFGRELAMAADALPGYRTELIEIHDPDVVRTSGLARHPALVPTGQDADVVAGSLLLLTPGELAAADTYEVDDYVRVAVGLASGATAWAYVSRAHVAPGRGRLTS